VEGVTIWQASPPVSTGRSRSAVEDRQPSGTWGDGRPVRRRQTTWSTRFLSRPAALSRPVYRAAPQSAIRRGRDPQPGSVSFDWPVAVARRSQGSPRRHARLRDFVANAGRACRRRGMRAFVIAATRIGDEADEVAVWQECSQVGMPRGRGDHQPATPANYRCARGQHRMLRRPGFTHSSPYDEVV